MKRAHLFTLLLVPIYASLTLTGCGDSTATPDPSKGSAQTTNKKPGLNTAALEDPSLANEQAPAHFRAEFKTAKGAIAFDCHRDWAPHGVDRFYNLVKIGFFTDIAMFRTLTTPKPFVVQFGIHGDPKISAKWQNAQLPADPAKESNLRGRLTYAMAGKPTTRTTQVFINVKDNSNLDAMGFAPICEIVGNGLDTVMTFNGEYGEKPTGTQGKIQAEGNAFLKATFPNLDYIQSASIVDMAIPPPAVSAAVSSEPSADPLASAAPSTSASASAAPGASASAAPSSKPGASAAPKTSAAPKVTK